MRDERVLRDTPVTGGLRSQIALPTPVAIWVLAAHAIALLTPLLLLKTRAQFLHGCVALASTAGIWVAAWAVYSGAAGRPQGWAFVIALAAAIGLLALSLKQRLERISATPRRNG